MIFKFEQMALDPANFCLKRGCVPINLEPQVFNVLRYLIEQRHRVVTRQELLDALWQGKVVSDATLSNHIKMARAAIGDDGEAQLMIKTVRGRGYQFVALVTEASEDVAIIDAKTPAAKRPNWLVFIPIVTVILVVGVCGFWVSNQLSAPTLNGIDNPALVDASIAILPFENRSDNAADEHFAEGVHHDLLMQVAKIRGIRTISRTSVYLYRDRQKSIPNIASELGVSVVLEGGVQRAGQEIRVNVQLINGLNDELIWAESYTRALTAENVFAIQSEIANAIADALALALSPAEQDAIAEYSTENINALEAYFLARAAMSKNNNHGFQMAINHLHKALEIDSNFAMAYAVLAQLYLDQIYWAGAPMAQQLSLSSPLVQRALSINPKLSEAHAALASLQEYQGQYSEALASYETAIKYKPNNEKVYAALGRFYLWIERDLEASIEHFNHALRLNPKDNLLKENLTEALIRHGRFEDARALVNEILTENPNFSAAYRALADLEAWQNKNIPAAQSFLLKAINLEPGVPSYTLKLALRYLELGKRDLALAWLHKTVDAAPNNNSSQFATALTHYIEGRIEEAFEAFLNVPNTSPYFSQSISYLLDVGLQLGRIEHLEKFFRAALPELHLPQPKVNARNYVSAYMLAKLLQQNGDNARAKMLLEQSLGFALQNPVGDWQGEHRDWLSKIYMALGDKDNALRSYMRWVDLGYYSALVDTDPNYEFIEQEADYIVQRNRVRSALNDAQLELLGDDK